MPTYLVHVHPKPANVTIPVASDASEYEVEAPDLMQACRRVVDAPVLLGNGAVRRQTREAYTGRYLEADETRYAAVAHVPEGRPDRIPRAVMGSGVYAEVVVLAQEMGRARRRRDEATLVDMILYGESWQDPGADHAAALRSFVENDWTDEEVAGRSWFHELDEELAGVGLGETVRGTAYEAYWTDVAKLVERLAEDRVAAPAPR